MLTEQIGLSSFVTTAFKHGKNFLIVLLSGSTFIVYWSHAEKILFFNFFLLSIGLAWWPL